MDDSRLLLGGVPVRIHDPGAALGMVLVGHGGGESKDAPRIVRLCQQLAAATGLAAVCIDAVDHGDRRPTGTVPPGIPVGWHSTTAPKMAADWASATGGLGRGGPPRAYVGVSIETILGPAVATAIGSLETVVLVVGGIPGGWVDDPRLEPMLLDAA